MSSVQQPVRTPCPGSPRRCCAVRRLADGVHGRRAPQGPLSPGTIGRETKALPYGLTPSEHVGNNQLGERSPSESALYHRTIRTTETTVRNEPLGSTRDVCRTACGGDLTRTTCCQAGPEPSAELSARRRPIRAGRTPPDRCPRHRSGPDIRDPERGRGFVSASALAAWLARKGLLTGAFRAHCRGCIGRGQRALYSLSSRD